MAFWDAVWQKGYYWGPLAIVLVAEHLILTYFYKRPSSLSRLVWLNSDSSRTDAANFAVFYLLIGRIVTFVRWIFLSGLAYMGLLYLHRNFPHSGLLSDIVPHEGVLGVLCWLLLLDISVYSAHVALHKIPFLWRFDRLHHAATEFNIITGTRVTLAEKFLTDIFILAIMTIVFGIPGSAVTMSVLFIRKFVDIVQHSDLPWDYGPLGYVFASPRYHRLYHSSHTSEIDANYADIFVIWDYLFRTVAPRWHVDPTAADRCELGLCERAETDNVNRTLPALVRESLVRYAYMLVRPVARAARNRMQAMRTRSGSPPGGEQP